MPRAAGRPATGTMVVPAFRRVDRCTPVPIGPAVRALCPEMLGHTNITAKMPQPNFLQPTHYAQTPMIKAYARASALLSLEAGTA